jgi:ABC-type amino acid transport substrate-binding protein
VGHPHLSRQPLRRLIAALALGLSALIAPLAAAEARPLDEVKASGVLRVTVYRDNKPWSWIENGKPTGIDVDIGTALAKSLGVKPEFIDLRADDRIDDDLRNGVWKGSVVGDAPGDVMLHVPYDKELEVRNDLVKLTAPYHVDGLAMAIDPGNVDRARDFSLFETEKISVDVGSLADFVLVSAKDHRLIPNVVHARGTERAFQAYEAGEVVAVYGASAEIEAAARASKRPVVVIYPDTQVRSAWTLGLAVRINSRDLGYALADAIEQMKTSGEMQAIFERYGVNWRPPKLAE